MFTHHVNLLHTTYRYDPVHEDIVTHIRHRLLLYQHFHDIAHEEDKKWRDCSTDDCKHLVTMISPKVIISTKHFCGLVIFETNSLNNKPTTPKKRRSVSVLSRNLNSSASPTYVKHFLKTTKRAHPAQPSTSSLLSSPFCSASASPSAMCWFHQCYLLTASTGVFLSSFSFSWRPPASAVSDCTSNS